MTQLIRSLGKGKLPRGWAYPLGAEAISLPLEGVSHFSELSLYFRRPPKSTAEQTSSAALQLVLEASFYRHRLGLSESNECPDIYGPTWGITVRPVRRDQNVTVRGLLLSEGIPAVREWLNAERAETWMEGRKWLRIWFNAKDGLLTIEEGEG